MTATVRVLSITGLIVAGTCAIIAGEARQFELVMFDLPHGLSGFGTAWSVRTRFDRHGRLVQHMVHVGACCGP
jgi:hypothetical protein